MYLWHFIFWINFFYTIGPSLLLTIQGVSAVFEHLITEEHLTRKFTGFLTFSWELISFSWFALAITNLLFFFAVDDQYNRNLIFCWKLVWIIYRFLTGFTKLIGLKQGFLKKQAFSGCIIDGIIASLLFITLFTV